MRYLLEHASSPALHLIICLAIVAVAIVWTAPFIYKALHLRRLAHAAKGKLVLTYDDGPDRRLTPQLLDLLARYDVTATFFLLGFRAQRSPEMCDLLVQHGHDLGSHAQHHLHARRVFPLTAVRNVTEGYQSVSRWVADNAAFRPPYGAISFFTLLAAFVRRAPIRLWTCDGGDTQPTLPRADDVVDRFLQAGGGVVLLHNHDRDIEREQYVLQLTEQLILRAKPHGFAICPLRSLTF